MTELQKRMNKIVKAVAALEGKKKQVSAGDIREVLKCLAAYEAATIIKMIRESEDYDHLSSDELFAKWNNVQGDVAVLLDFHKDMFLRRAIDRGLI